MAEEGECNVCKLPAKQRCGGCKLVYYCNKDHQAIDWNKGHKKQCRKLQSDAPCYKICEDSVLGRYLIANRDIKIGEIILRESPLVEAPSQYTAPVCFQCYEELTAETAQACELCGWPACINCYNKKKYNYHEAECKITRDANKKININVFQQHHPSYQSLALIRCFHAKFNNHDTWQKISLLQSHCEERKKDTERIEIEKNTVGKFLLNYLSLSSKGFTEDDVIKMCGVLQINGHEVPTSNPPHVVIYSTVSLLEHSCIPNCTRRYILVSPGSNNIEIRALKFIPKGSHLSICYSDPLWCTGNRRIQLQQTKYFDCKCERCADPEELGTMLSAIKCSKTAKCCGYLLPINALDENSQWKCNKCNKEVPKEQIGELLVKIGSELARLPPGDCEALESFISRNSDINLHPNHQYLIDATLALIQMWGKRCGPTGLSSEPDYVVASKLRMCEQLRTIADKVAPGPTALRGLVLMELQNAKGEEARRQLINGELDPSALRVVLMKSRGLLVEAVNIFKLEAMSEQDQEQAKIAVKSLTELDEFICSLPK